MTINGRIIADGELADGRRPPPLPANPAPGAKWKAKQALAFLNLNGPDHDVALCLLEHANNKTGLCYPSEERISAWTARTLRTVRRSVKPISLAGIAKVGRRKNRRGTVSNHYWINGPLLFAAYEKQKVASRSAKSGRSLIQKVAAEPRKGEPRKKEPRALNGGGRADRRETEAKMGNQGKGKTQ